MPDFATRDGLIATLAEAMADCIRTALAERGSAQVALAGGSTPFPVYRKLAAAADIDWKHVTILPTDERRVPMGDPLHNGAQLGAIFTPLGAPVVQLHPGDKPPVATPLDLVLIGMGLDGHTASLFPGPDLEAGFASADPVVPVTPDPLPPDAPVARLSLSASALAGARRLLLLLTGAEKRAVFDTAMAQTPPAKPIARLAARAPIELWWAA